METNVQVLGTITANLYDEDGNLLETVAGDNLVVNSGTALIASIFGNSSTAYPSYMAVGTSNTAVSATQTALVTEVARVSMSTAIASNVITYTATFGAGVGTGTLYECGLFNASSAGTMISRSLALTITKGASDTLTITWSLTISGS